MSVTVGRLLGEGGERAAFVHVSVPWEQITGASVLKSTGRRPSTRQVSTLAEGQLYRMRGIKLTAERHAAGLTSKCAFVCRDGGALGIVAAVAGETGGAAINAIREALAGMLGISVLPFYESRAFSVNLSGSDAAWALDPDRRDDAAAAAKLRRRVDDLAVEGRGLRDAPALLLRALKCAHSEWLDI